MTVLILAVRGLPSSKPRLCNTPVFLYAPDLFRNKSRLKCARVCGCESLLLWLPKTLRQTAIKLNNSHSSWWSYSKCVRPEARLGKIKEANLFCWPTRFSQFKINTFQAKKVKHNTQEPWDWDSTRHLRKTNANKNCFWCDTEAWRRIQVREKKMTRVWHTTTRAAGEHPAETLDNNTNRVEKCFQIIDTLICLSKAAINE